MTDWRARPAVRWTGVALIALTLAVLPFAHSATNAPTSSAGQRSLAVIALNSAWLNP